MDPVTYAVLDYTVYYADMSLPNYQTDGPTWTKYYSIKEEYGSLLSPPVTEASDDLTPAFWNDVTTLFENDDEVFQQYYARKTRGYSKATCTGSCKTNELCQLRSSRSDYACFSGSGGISIKKRETEGEGHGHGSEGSCPGSTALPYLKKLGANFSALGQVVSARKKR